MAGAIAKQILQINGVEVFAYVNSVGDVRLQKNEDLDLSAIFDNDVRCPDECANIMAETITNIKILGDTIGGEITAVAKGVPAGWRACF